jgi:hypothetical protein
MQIKRRRTLGILFSLTLMVGAASFSAPRSHALATAVPPENSIRHAAAALFGPASLFPPRAIRFLSVSPRASGSSKHAPAT